MPLYELVGSVLAELNKESEVARRYFSAESLATLIDHGKARPADSMRRERNSSLPGKWSSGDNTVGKRRQLGHAVDLEELVAMSTKAG